VVEDRMPQRQSDLGELTRARDGSWDGSAVKAPDRGARSRSERQLASVGRQRQSACGGPWFHSTVVSTTAPQMTVMRMAIRARRRRSPV
jgi:hypothetical protein